MAGRRFMKNAGAIARLAAVAWLVAARGAAAQQDIEYRLSLPEPEHHWLQVDATFSHPPAGALQLHMSRSSPGRYALHEFAKNLYELQVTDAGGGAIAITQATPSTWDVPATTGPIHVRYRLFGDRVDGTYDAIDTTHAHLNMPATLIWMPGTEHQAVRVVFARPKGHDDWAVATQLYPTDDPLAFTAPNLQFLMDSPAEFSAMTWRSFPAPVPAGSPSTPATIRISLHHTGTDQEATQFADGVKLIVAAEARVFGEFPPYENSTYTFLADYLPWADGDGMEHRNSTVLTSRRALAGGRIGMLNTVAHEFFHCWNVERIRPKTLEPFDFDRANMSGELWLAEGVTSYYDGLIMARSGLFSLDDFTHDLTGIVNAVVTSPATRFRSAEDMSRLAPFVDAASWIDRTNWNNTFISYYTFGAALGVGLDLAIREHTGGHATLDDFMRAMWRAHGKPGGTERGYVDRPYTAQDIRDHLAEVTDPAFADDVMNRYVHGHEVMDYARLLQQAGLILRKRHAGVGTLGELRLERSGNLLRIAAPTLIGSAAYAAGLDDGDEIKSVGGDAVTSPEQVDELLGRYHAGDHVAVVVLRRGVETTADAVLAEDQRVDVVTAESNGTAISPAQQAFRDAWLR